MHTTIGIGVFTVLMVGLMSGSNAGPEQVALPENYRDSFIHYHTLDKRDQDPDVVRMIYVDPKVGLVARSGAPLPAGTRLVMVDRIAARNADGSTQLSRDGRMVPTDQVKQILVSEKRAGFGAEHGEMQTGDWEFAAFLGDGSRKLEVNFDLCRECHLQAERFDYTFSVFPNLDAIKR